MRSLGGAVLAGVVAAQAAGAADYMQEAPAARDARMAWFKDARFGMFIHWGLYAIPAGVWEGKGGHAEWIRTTAHIPLGTYEKFVQQFNPTNFNADAWVAMAKNAGMKYIVITSKHHDGFCLWDSKCTDFDVASTPFKRDILRELRAACDQQGVTLCFYHSIMDWHHPDYLPRRDWEKDRSAGGADFEKYVAYLKSELKELVTGYGPLGILWFDGEWESTWNHERGVDLYNYVRGLQPSIIVNNRVDKGRKGMQGMNNAGEFAGDYGTPEQEIPARGFGDGVAWESCMTMNNTWGYTHDAHWKSSTDLIRKLADIASKGGNFLLNVGPQPDGNFPPEIVQRLADLGAWTKVNGESIYGTTATPFKRLPYRCTKRPGKLYVHVFDWPADGRIVLPGLKSEVKKAYALKDPAGAPWAVANKDGVVEIAGPAAAPDAADSVVVVELEGLPEVEAASGAAQEANGTVRLAAADAEIHGEGMKFDEGGNDLGFWTRSEDWASWKFTLAKPGTFEVEVDFACKAGSEGSVYAVNIIDQSVGGTVRSTGSWTKYETDKPGRLTIPEKGEYLLTLKGRKAGGEGVMNVREIRLTPVP